VDPAKAAIIDIVGAKGATLSSGVRVELGGSGNEQTLTVDGPVAATLTPGTLYLARFADGSRMRAFRVKAGGECVFYPQVTGTQVPRFDLGGVMLTVALSQVMLEAVRQNAGKMEPVMLENVTSGSSARAVLVEAGTCVQFEAAGDWSALAQGLTWSIGTDAASISAGRAAPKIGHPDGWLYVVIDRYGDRNQPIVVETLATAQLASTDVTDVSPMTVTFRFYRMYEFDVTPLISNDEVTNVAPPNPRVVDASGLDNVSAVLVSIDDVPGGVMPGIDAGDSLLAGTLSNVRADPSPFASASVAFYVVPSKAIAQALFESP